jgi:GTP1/Obg family GTP-binding protein
MDPIVPNDGLWVGASVDAFKDVVERRFAGDYADVVLGLDSYREAADAIDGTIQWLQRLKRRAEIELKRKEAEREGVLHCERLEVPF